MLQSDSTIVELLPAHRPDSTVRVKPAKPKTVMQVLNQLPANATPAQQDSAVQANFKPGKRIYNMRPDTIGITPGTRIQRDQRVSDLQNYHNPYLFKEMLNYTAVENDRYGVAADPVPYTLSNDNVITALLIGCFIMAIIAIAEYCDRSISPISITTVRPAAIVPETEIAIPILMKFDNLKKYGEAILKIMPSTIITPTIVI